MIFRRYKFESANVLRTLRSIIKSLYQEQASNQSVFGELLSLETMYEMVLSHSQFLDVILSSDGQSNTKGDSPYFCYVLILLSLFIVVRPE